MSKATRRWVRWAVALAGVAAATVWLTRPLWRGVEVAVVVPAVGAVAQTVVSSGRVVPSEEIAVASVRLGVVASVAVDEGDHVEAGQLLVALDPTEAQAAVARAEATLEGATARRRALESVLGPGARERLRAARAQRDQARRDAIRVEALVAERARTEAEREQSATALLLAESALRSALADVRAVAPDGADAAALDAAEAEARAALDEARARLAQTRIVAPTAGVVQARHVAAGEVAQPGVRLLTIAEDGPLRLVIAPDERNLSALALGQVAVASADAYPDARFDARVDWIAPAVDSRRGTIELRLAALNPPPGLLPDMTVSVELEIDRRERALTLPRSAVRDLASAAPWVLVVADGRAARRPVTLGLRGDRVVEVTDGLTAGDSVIAPGADDPAPGARVVVARPEGG